MLSKTQTANNDPPATHDWEALAKAGKIEDAIEAYVRRHDYSSLVELQNRLQSYMPTRGDYDLCLAKNVVLWAGMSEQFVGAIQSLLRAKRVHLHPSSALVYFIDGGGLRLPVAKSIPPGGFRHPRWLPATLRIVPINRRPKSKPKERYGVNSTALACEAWARMPCFSCRLTQNITEPATLGDTLGESPCTNLPDVAERQLETGGSCCYRPSRGPQRTRHSWGLSSFWIAYFSA